MNDDELRAELRRLNDINEVRNLGATYCRACDLKSLDVLRQAFAEDVVVDFGGHQVRGIEQVGAVILGVLTNVGTTQHLIGSQTVTVVGDRATHRAYVQAQHLAPADPKDWTLFGGMYTDECERGPDGWRIVRRHYEQLWDLGNTAMVWGNVTM